MNPRIEAKVIGEYGVEQAMFGMGLSFGLCSGIGFNNFVNNRVDIQERMTAVFENNATKDGGHNKFLESMQIWLDVNAPRFWWSEADTYRVGSTKQSESTMHTLVKQLDRIGKMMREEAKDGMGHESSLFDFFSGRKSMEELNLFIENNFDLDPEESDSDFILFNEEKNNILNIMLKTTFSLAYMDDDIKKLVFVKRMLPESFMQRRVWNINYKTLRNMYLQRNGHRLPHWNMFLEQVIEQLKHPEFIKMEMKMFGNLKLGGE